MMAMAWKVTERNQSERTCDISVWKRENSHLPKARHCFQSSTYNLQNDMFRRNMKGKQGWYTKDGGRGVSVGRKSNSVVTRWGPRSGAAEFQASDKTDMCSEGSQPKAELTLNLFHADLKRILLQRILQTSYQIASGIKRNRQSSKHSG